MDKAEALDAIEHACVRKAELRFSDFDATACGCARDQIESEFQEDGELTAIAALARIEVDMGMTSVDDFQALEQLRRRYNSTISQLSDAGRRRLVSVALHEAVIACRTPA
jgi:hypothetical protein